MTTTTGETAEEQKAREEAHARRQRILDGAGSRMDVVEGVIPSAAAAGDGSKSASKLAAMRRRRFKKKTDGGTEESTTPVTENAVVNDTVEMKEAAPEVNVQQAESVVSTPTKTSLSTESGANATAEAGTETPSAQVEGGGGETKKKYMGVAKMRRLKLKEKQQQEQDQPDDMTTGEPSSFLAKQHVMKKRKATARLPIIMHIVTLLLLFVAGLDIGLQQVAIDYQRYDGSTSVLDVHTTLAPRTSGGVSFLMSKLSGNFTFVRGGGDMKVRLLEEINDKVTNAVQHVVEKDEFAELDSENDTMKTAGIIDPIFGVDLDNLTAGSGPRLWAARQAVKFHRLLLRIFYYGPVRIFYWLLACATSPPIFCLVALLLRQLVGKAILGAALPDARADEEQQKDVMSMVKTFVSNFIFSAFPTAVSLYDAWSHLRADMYVVLCGFFCGLALSHTPAIASSDLFVGFFNKTSSSDEL